MLKKGLSSSAKFLLITLVSVFGLSISHVATTSAASMSAMNMAGHGAQSGIQCQSSCTSALPVKKQDELLQLRKDDEEPKPQPYYAIMLSAGLLAALFIVKRSASFISSWRPPDILGLCGQRLFYA